MSTAYVSSFYDVRDVIQQNHRNNQKQTVERRNTIGAGPVNNNIGNFSIGNFTSVPSSTTSTSQVISLDNQDSIHRENCHRKLDRSYSEPCPNNNSNENQRNANNAVNSSRYKTELCRPFEESGHCKYADKCQFAHGAHELRSLSRHPKYKTELCRTFHSKGFCPYGPRCNFIHNDDLRKLNQMNQNSKYQQHPQQQMVQRPNNSQSPSPITALPQRPSSINFSSSYIGSLGSTADSSPPSSVGSDSPSLSPVFFEDNLALNPCSSLPLFSHPLNFDNSSPTAGMFSNSTSSINSLASSSSSCSNGDFTSSLEVPLNIKTHDLTSDFELIQQQFSTILNLNNLADGLTAANPSSVFGEWDAARLLGAPLSSPDSISGESVGSSSSSSSTSSSAFSAESTTDSGKSVRLPVFNHISQHG